MPLISWKESNSGNFEQFTARFGTAARVWDVNGRDSTLRSSMKEQRLFCRCALRSRSRHAMAQGGILPEELLEMIFLLLPLPALRKFCVLSRTWEAWLCSRSFWDAWRKKNANSPLHGHWMVSTQPSGVDYFDRDGNSIYLLTWVVGLRTDSGKWHKLPDKLLAGRDAKWLAAGDGLVVSCGPRNRPVVFNPCTMWYEVLPHPQDESRRPNQRSGLGMLSRGRGIVLLSDKTFVYEAASKEWRDGPGHPNLDSGRLCCFEEHMWAFEEETLWQFDTRTLLWRDFQVADLTVPVSFEGRHGQLFTEVHRHLFTDGVSLMMVGCSGTTTEDVVVCKLEPQSDNEFHQKLVAKVDAQTWRAYLDSHPQRLQHVDIYFFGQGDVVHALMESSVGIGSIPGMLWWNFKTGECGLSDLCPYQPTSCNAHVPFPVVFEPCLDAKF